MSRSNVRFPCPNWTIRSLRGPIASSPTRTRFPGCRFSLFAASRPCCGSRRWRPRAGREEMISIDANDLAAALAADGDEPMRPGIQDQGAALSRRHLRDKASSRKTARRSRRRVSISTAISALAVGSRAAGEIQAPAEVLKGLFGLPDLQLLTDRGFLLDLSFSDTTLAPASDVAHVDVSGQLPTRPPTGVTDALVERRNRKDGSEIAASLPAAWPGIRALPLCRRVRRGERSAADHGVGHRALGRRSLAGSGPHREIAEIRRIRGPGPPDPGSQRGRKRGHSETTVRPAPGAARNHEFPLSPDRR